MRNTRFLFWFQRGFDLGKNLLLSREFKGSSMMKNLNFVIRQLLRHSVHWFWPEMLDMNSLYISNIFKRCIEENGQRICLKTTCFIYQVQSEKQKMAEYSIIPMGIDITQVSYLNNKCRICAFISKPYSSHDITHGTEHHLQQHKIENCKTKNKLATNRCGVRFYTV